MTVYLFPLHPAAKNFSTITTRTNGAFANKEICNVKIGQGRGPGFPHPPLRIAVTGV